MSASKLIKLSVPCLLLLVLSSSLCAGDTLSAALKEKLAEVKRLKYEDPDAAKAILLELHQNKEDYNVKEQWRILATMGALYSVGDDYERGVEYFIESAKVAGQHDSIRLLAYSYGGLSSVYNSIERYETALNYVRQSIQLIKDKNFHGNLAQSYGSMANIQKNLGDLDSSVYFYNQAYTLFDSLGDEHNMAITAVNLSGLNYKLEEPDKVIFYAQKAVLYSEKAGHSRMYVSAKMNLAIGYEMKDQFSESIKILTTTRDSAAKYNLLRDISEIDFNLSELYLHTGDSLLGYKYLASHYEIKDSLLGLETQHQISELEVKYSTAQKEIEIQELNNDARLDRLRFRLFAALFLVVVLALVFVIRSYSKSLKQKQELLRKNREILALEQKVHQELIEKQALETKRIEQDLSFKTQKLTDFAIDITHKNEFSDSLLQMVSELERISDNKARLDKIREIKHYIRINLKSNEDLVIIEHEAGQLNLEFDRRLQEKFPDLTQNERTLCGLLRLGLQNKEISGIRGTSDNAIKMARYRLRKKLGLVSEVDITDFLKSI